MKNTEEALLVLNWKDFQDIFIEKNKEQNIKYHHTSLSYLQIRSGGI